MNKLRLLSNMSHFKWKKLREYSVKRWPEWMGMTHGVEHWDRVAKFGRMLYRKGAYMDDIDMVCLVLFGIKK